MQWGNLTEKWPEFPNVIGAFDATPHSIYRPVSESQGPFYSGHRHYHCMNTQLVKDNRGKIRFIQAGFLDSTHDATSDRLKEPIGPGLNRDIPLNARLLADEATLMKERY